MEIRNSLYTMRHSEYVNGLIDLINYINYDKPTNQLTMIEIGSYAGESTSIFASRFKQVISIDPFINDYDPNDITCQHLELEKVYEVFKNTISSYSNIIHIRKISDNAINDLKNQKVDFVYIDGLHTYDQVKKDIINYAPLINSNGFIGGHDYHPNWKGVVDGIEEILGIPDKIFGDTSWIKKIK